MNRPIRRHYAFSLAPAKGGWRVDHVAEFAARGEADKASLTLLGRHGDAAAITLADRELQEGDLLTAAELKR